MTKERANQLATEVYQYIFEMLDNEPEFNGYQAGEIAHEIENRFRVEISLFVGD